MSRFFYFFFQNLILQFLGYHIIEIPCAKLLLVLIARRSAEFAGTRFLKRGSNFKGKLHTYLINKIYSRSCC